MIDAQGRALARRIYLATAVLTAVGSLAAAGLGALSFLWGLLGGAALGCILLAGLIIVVWGLLAPAPGVMPEPRRRQTMAALQVVKYLVALGVLYLLVAYWQVHLIGLLVGMLLPVAVTAVCVVWRPRAGRGEQPGAGPAGSDPGAGI